MGSRHDYYGDNESQIWGGGTWSDIYYHGTGSMVVRASAHQSEAVKLWTDKRARYLEMGIAAWGVGIWGSADSSSIDVYGLCWVDVNVGGGNQTITASGPGEVKVRTADGDDNITIPEGGRYNLVAVAGGKDSIHLGLGVATEIIKGNGALSLDCSKYRSGWTTVAAGVLSGESKIHSRAYGNTINIDRVDAPLVVDISGLEANKYYATKGNGNQTVRVNSAGYNIVSTADGDDDITVVVGGRNNDISTGDGADRVRINSGINASVVKGLGRLDYSQMLYLTGSLEIAAQTAQVSGFSNSFSLNLKIDNQDASQPWKVARWKTYALGNADLSVNSRGSTWYADVFGGSWAKASLAGQNSLRISALLGTTINDNGGNNYLTTGVQYGSIVVWTDVVRNTSGATTIDLLGQKLDVHNNSGAGNLFLFNNGGVVGNLNFARSGNGLIDGEFGAGLASNIAMGQDANYVLNARNSGSTYSFSRNGNVVLDLARQGQYRFDGGYGNAALLTHGNLMAKQSASTTVHTLATVTNGAVAELGSGSSVVMHVPITLPADAQLLLYKTGDASRPQLDLYLVYQDDQKHTVSHRIQSLKLAGALPSVQIDLGGQGSLLLKDLNSDVVRPLLGTGANAVFKYFANRAGSGSDSFIARGEEASLQSALVSMWGAKSLLTLPGLANIGGISNGNFKRGAVDFSTDYRITDDPSTTLGAGSATLTDWIPDAWNFAAHDSPSGKGSKFLLVDGGPDVTKAFWRADVAGLQAGQDYALQFSMIVAAGPINQPRLQLYVNGVATGPVVSSKYEDAWVGRSISFHVPEGSAPVRLELKDLEPSPAYNDFAFGNVSVKPVDIANVGAISNGDFTHGLAAFSTDYRITDDPRLTLGAGSATLTDWIPDAWNFAAHGSPSGKGTKFLLVDGGPDVTKAFWRADVAGLQAGQDYALQFSMIVAAGPINPPRLQLYVNGVATGPVVSARYEDAWAGRSISFHVPDGSAPVRLELKDLEPSPAYNDFAFGNVSVKPVDIANVGAIANGDFTHGLAAFATDYRITDNPRTTLGWGSATLTDQMPEGWGFATRSGPTGNGSKFLLVDGSPDVSKAFWRTEVAGLQAGHDYALQLSMLSSGPNQARLQLYVNGVATGPVLTSRVEEAWADRTVSFRAPAGSAPVLLEFKDLESNSAYNDFGFGKVSLKPINTANFGVISNGDFTHGLADFSTDYRITDNPRLTLGYGSATLTDQMPEGWGFATRSGPTGDGSKFLLVDGGPDVSKAFWRADVGGLQAGQDYALKLSMINSAGPNQARLQLYVNGVATGPVITSKAEEAWAVRSISFRAPVGSAPVRLELKDLEPNPAYNDFGFGNVVLSPESMAASALVDTPTSQGVALDWARGVRVLHAQSAQEVGELATLSTYQNYLLANNVYGVAVLKDLDPVGIATLAPEFFRHVSAAVLNEWGNSGRLSKLTEPQIKALPINTVLEMLNQGSDQKLSADGADLLYQRLASRIDALSHEGNAPLTAQMLPAPVISHLGESTLRSLAGLPLYGTLSTDQRHAVDDAIKQFDIASTQRAHLNGMYSLLTNMPGLTADVLQQIRPEMDDVAIKNVLDLKLPGWKMWPYGFAYSTVSSARNFFSTWVYDMKKALPEGQWEAGASQIRDTINHWTPGEDDASKQSLLHSFEQLNAAYGSVKDQITNVDKVNGLYQSVRFYASLYRLVSAAGAMGADIEKSGQDSTAKALAVTKLVSTMASCLQVPVNYLMHALVSHAVDGNFKQFGDGTEFGNALKDKDLPNPFKKLFEMRGEMASPMKSGSIVGDYTEALKTFKAEVSKVAALAEIDGVNHIVGEDGTSLQSMLDRLLESKKNEPLKIGSNNAEAFRICTTSLICLSADVGGIITALWGAVDTGKALANGDDLSSTEIASKSLTLLQQLISSISSFAYLASDAASWLNSMVNINKFSFLSKYTSSLPAIEAAGISAGAVLSLIATGVDMILHGLNYTAQNILQPTLALIQDMIFITLDVIAMAVPEVLPFVVLFEVTMPNFQSAAMAAVMYDRLSLISDVSGLLGYNTAVARDGVLEQGYLASCAPFKSLYMLQNAQYGQMVGSSMLLGALVGPAATAAVTTTLKNLIQYEPDFSDAPGNNVNAQSNFAKLVLAENLLFNFLTSDVPYLSGGSGLIDWGRYRAGGGGQQAVRDKLALLSNLYQQDFRFMLNIASGKNTTLPNGQAVSQNSYAVLSDIGPYTGLAKIVAPTHMYHQLWRLGQDGAIDLYLPVARMADIDKNLHPDVINAVSLGLSGESVHLSTAEGKRANLYFIGDGANLKGKDEHLYLEKGNFLIKVTSSDAQQHMVLHAGDGASTLEGAREMIGSDHAATIFLASAKTQVVTGSAKQADTLGFADSLNLSTVSIKEGKISYEYLDGKDSKQASLSYSNIQNFAISDKTDRIDFSLDGNHPASLLVTDTAKQIVINSGKQPVVILADKADNSRVDLYSATGEVAANTLGNKVVVHKAGSSADDFYVLSARSGNELDAYDAAAKTYFQMRSDGPGMGRSSAAWKGLASLQSENAFSFGLNDLLDTAKPAQLFVNGGAGKEDTTIDRVDLSNIAGSLMKTTTVRPEDIRFSFNKDDAGSYKVGDHTVSTGASLLTVSVAGTNVMEVHALRNMAPAKVDFYLDNVVLSHQVIG